MKKIKFIIVALMMCFSFISISQDLQKANYNEVVGKTKKGKLNSYTTKYGENFKVGDTITLGVPFRNEIFDFIVQNAEIATYPLQALASGSRVVIKEIKAYNRLVYVKTTKAQGYIYGCYIINFESALSNGEVKSNIMSSDEALTELKKAKDKLELGLISEEEYNNKKQELIKYIK